MEFLKPCPFCGGENIFVDGYEHCAGIRWRCRVLCLDCMATIDDVTVLQKYRTIKTWRWD